MTTTAEHCIAYRHERSFHDLIILPLDLQALCYASYGDRCCVEPIAVSILQLTVDGYTYRMFILHTARMMISSGCPEVM